MKPTPAEMLNGMPRSHSASDAADGRERDVEEDEQRGLDLAEGQPEQEDDQAERERHDDRQAGAGRRRSCWNWPPHSMR